MENNTFDVRLIDKIEDKLDDNIDVIVKLGSGEEFVLSFFTITNIQNLMLSYKPTGECASGKYFWASDMVLVNELSMDIIKDSVADIIKDDSIHLIGSPTNDLAEDFVKERERLNRV